ncbi:MAG TPA: sporulation protein YunB, partial [Clostridiales bacterium]|nr:sporulation protein YunB [Clostridiales bacterium]
MKWRRWKKSQKKLVIISISIAVFLILAVVIVQASIGPVMDEVAVIYSKNTASQIIESAIYQIMEEMDTSYSDFVVLEKDESGKVQALKTNVIAVNTLKSKASLLILEKLQDEDVGQFKIPFGTLTGSNLLSGMGPNVTIRLVPAGSVVSTAENNFTSAGINQTRHQIMLKVEVTLKAV